MNSKRIKKKLTEAITNSEIMMLRICCFTSIANNLLMWAHYAKSHSGCCLAFDLNGFIESTKHIDLSLIPVKYQKEFTTINYYTQNKRAIISWQTLKSEDWAYEKEIRAIIVDNFINTAPLFLPTNVKLFKAIYLGCKINPEKKKEIIDICLQKYPHMKIYQMTPAENNFKLIPTLL